MRSGAVTAARQDGRVIVLHTAWLSGSGRLALWAEDADAVRTAPARRGRPARRPRSHPFALDPDGLRLAVAEVGGMEASDLLGEEHVDITLQIPDSGGVPIVSPLDDEIPADVRGGPPAISEAEEHLSLWTTAGYVLDSSAAAKFLPMLTSARNAVQPFADSDPGPSRVDLGSDVRFAAHAVDLVVELLARGRLLPALDFVEDQWRARWRPLVDGPTAAGSRRWPGHCRPRSWQCARPHRTRRAGSHTRGQNPATRCCAL